MLSPRKFGCRVCGKVGCDHVQDAPVAAARPPSDHRQRGELANLCPVCKRDKRLCICISHSSIKPMADIADRASFKQGKPLRPYDSTYVEVLINEGLNLYYARDAEGLARWLRRVLP